jgi:DNA-binding IclR family transcriptional regulator
VKTDFASRNTPRSYNIHVIEKAFSVLAAFEPDGAELSLGEIVERSGESQSSVFRLLASLVSVRAVERDPVSKRYRVGSRLYALGSLAVLDLRRALMPYMEALRDEFGRLVNLAIREAHETVLVEVLDTGRPLRVTSSIGGREPLHCTAAGKCLAAFDPHCSMPPGPLRRYTSATITSRAKLARELAQVRAQAHAYDRGEYAQHARCIAVPVFGGDGSVCAALSISGIEDLLEPATSATVVQRLTDAAVRGSRALGLSPTAPWPPSGAQPTSSGHTGLATRR